MIETLEEIRMYCGEKAAEAVEENVLMLQAISDVYQTEIDVIGEPAVKFKEMDIEFGMRIKIMQESNIERSEAEVNGKKVIRLIGSANMVKPGCLLKLIKMIRGEKV